MAGRTAVGIVLDAGTMQAVELATDGDGLVVRRAVSDRLPPEAFTDSEITDVNAVADAVRRILRAHKLPRRHVCVALGGRLAIARVIEAGAASGGEVEQVLQDRIGRYAIYENLQVLWKATPLKTNDAEKRAFLAAVIAKEQVDALLPALGRAGVRVSHIEPYALAAIRSLTTCVGEDERPTILMSLRDESTDFVIVKGGQPLLVRSIEQGAGVLSRRPERMEDLLVEARRSVEFCQSRFADVRPRLWIGQAADEDPEVCRGLLACVKQDLADADVEAMPDWPPQAGGADGGAAPSWAAVGAAMVGLSRDETTPHLNLVPEEWPTSEKVQKQLMGMVASVGMGVVLTVIVSMILRVTAGDTAETAVAASVQMEANTVNVKTASQVKAQASEAAARVKLWKDVRATVRPSDWTAALESVASQVPEGVRVREVSCRRGTLRLKGQAQLADLVHHVVERLNRLPLLEGASIERLVRNPGAGAELPEYVITCQLREGQPAEAPVQTEKGSKDAR
ncbi:MAG TPA: pilus assembly protein PilM [Phycisphaerae bacterium]|nr:pilus assembly protein PilM [Phycisphaerae bacterium]